MNFSGQFQFMYGFKYEYKEGFSRPINLFDKSKLTSPYLVVKDTNQKIICKVDTLGKLTVYGDTTTVLKTIIRNFGIKVN